MKKIFYLILPCCLSTFFVKAQNVGVGNTNPGFRLDVSGRMRIRSGGTGSFSASAGIFFNDTANTFIPAFVGMQNDEQVGFYGNTSGWSMVMNTINGRVGINTVSPAATLHVADSTVVFTGPSAIPPVTTTVNLTVEGAGTRMMWFPALGAFRAGYVDDYQWDKGTMGRLSFATGWNTRASGENSTAMGHATIAAGPHSTAIGNNAEAYGNSSVAIGSGTLSSGHSSISIGSNTFATGSGAIAMGTQADASGISSMALGYNTTASEQYAIAMGAGTVASGFVSTAFGAGSVASGYASFTAGDGTVAKANGSFSIGILNDNTDNPDPLIQLPGDRIFQIGNGDNISRGNVITVLRNGKVGIGELNPSKGGLEVNKKEGATNAVFGGNTTGVAIESSFPGIGFNTYDDGFSRKAIATGYGGYIGVSATNGGMLFSVTNASFPAGSAITSNLGLYINSNGNVGVGTSNPSQKLHVAGNICATGTIGACSDIRYKTNFSPVKNSLASVLSLHGIYYNWKVNEFPDMEFSNNRQLGFSAQEVEKLFPEVVMTDSNGYRSVDYGRLTPVLVEAIKEQQQQIQKLEKEITEMKTLIKTCLKNKVPASFINH